MNKLIIFLFYIIGFFFFTSTVLAANEFKTSYDITYKIENDGKALVEQKVTLKNLTPTFYATKFNILVPSTNLVNIKASDNQVPLTVNTKRENNLTNLEINLNQQITGVDKENIFNVSYESNDFSQKFGKNVQIFIPKLALAEEVENINLSLITPTSWGDPTLILPEPETISEIGGNLVFNFSKDQIQGKGVKMIFGEKQTTTFEIVYKLQNNSLLPSIASVALPSNTTLQEINIEKISPQPENVVLDTDGNFLALFKLPIRGTRDVIINGTASISLNPRVKPQIEEEANLNKYLGSSTFWQKDDPAVKQKLLEILKDKDKLTNHQKAELIQNFVGNHLQFNQERYLSNNDYRLGALTVLNNPEDALSLEYADLFIALSRGAKIPTRLVVGATLNTQTPNFLVEFYDPARGWIMIDPTMQSISGQDYFNKLDLSHLKVSHQGIMKDLIWPTQVKIAPRDQTLTDKTLIADAKLEYSIDIPAEILAGFPSKGKVKIANNGFAYSKPATVSFLAKDLEINPLKVVNVDAIAPFGLFEYRFSISANPFWKKTDDVLQIKINEELFNRPIKVNPFFSLSLLPLLVSGIIGSMILIYLLTLIFHLKTNNQPTRNKRKKRR
ncbi:transglutaminase family protein [Candidatus Daviesbacteria bacterium]|nr:transglutaminase family protein [Candidatus Daviesbacteria bacterium]